MNHGNIGINTGHIRLNYGDIVLKSGNFQLDIDYIYPIYGNIHMDEGNILIFPWNIPLILNHNQFLPGF